MTPTPLPPQAIPGPGGVGAPRLAQWPMAHRELGRGRKRPGPGQAQAWREKHLLWAFLPPRPRSPRWLVGSGQVSPKQEEARCRPAVERLTPEAFLTSALPRAPHRVPGGALAADGTWSGCSASRVSCQGRCPVLVAHTRPPATTHPSAEKPRLRGSGAAGAPGFGSGRRQGTVGPGPARGQESGLKLQLCRSLTGRCPGRWGRCSAITAEWTLGPQGPGSSWLRLAPQRPAADREVPTPMEQGQWGSRQAGQLGTCSWAWRLGSGRGLFRSGAPERGLGRTRRPMGMYTKAVWKAGRSGPALREGREWPAEEQRRAAHQTGGQAAAWRGQGTEGRARPPAVLWPRALSFSACPGSP